MDLLGDSLRGDVMDKTFTPVEPFDFGLVDIQPDDMISFSAKLKAQREPDIAQTNDCQGRLHIRREKVG